MDLTERKSHLLINESFYLDTYKRIKSEFGQSLVKVSINLNSSVFRAGQNGQIPRNMCLKTVESLLMSYP